MKAKGFTLIELMIVVAIIGILAAVIIPQVTGGSSKKSPGMQSSTSASSGEQCIGGVKVMVNRNGDSYQLKDSKGNGISC